MPRRSLMLLGIIFLATILINIPVLSQPFGRDQGIFAYIGDGMRSGYVPYRDSWDHKPPGIDFIYFLALTLFGRTMPAAHLLETIGILLTTLFVYLAGRRVAGEGTGLIGAAAYGLGTTLFTEWWDRLQAEYWMALAFAAALWCAVEAIRSKHRLFWLVGTGFGIATALWFKPTALTMLPALALLVLLPLSWLQQRQYMKLARRAISDSLALLIGALLASAPWLLYFVANGALNDLIEAVIMFNVYHTSIGGNPTPGGLVAGTLDFGRRLSILGLLSMVGMVYAVLRARTSEVYITIAWLLGAVAGVWWQGKYFSYHWTLALPPLCILAGYGLLALAQDLRNSARIPQQRGSTSLAAYTLPIIYAFVLLAYVTYLGNDAEQRTKWSRELGHLFGRITEQEYLRQFGHNIRGSDVYSFSATLETADYLRANTAPDDTVLVWSFQALVNWLADRRAPTRYVFNYPLTFDRPTSEFRAQARRTFMNDMRAKQPKYVVLVSNDVNPLQPVDSMTLLAGFPELRNLIAQEYVLEKEIADFHIYKRR